MIYDSKIYIGTIRASYQSLFSQIRGPIYQEDMKNHADAEL